MWLLNKLLNYGLILGLLNMSCRCKAQVGLTSNSIINTQGICETMQCTNEVNTVLKNVNPDVNVCDDFYNATCGNFINKAQIPLEKTQAVPHTDDDDLTKDVQSCISENVVPNEEKYISMVKNMYKSCIDTNTIANIGLKPLKDIIKDFGGWPAITTDWKEESFDLAELIKKSRNIGYSGDYFITFSIDLNSKNTAKRIITLDQATLVLPQDELLKGMDSDYVKAYYKYMGNMTKLLGENVDENKVLNELRNVIEFENALAKISMTPEQRADLTKLYNPMPISQVSNSAWLVYINKIMDSNNQVDGNTEINVADVNFIKELKTLLDKTEKRIQANYLIWRIVYDSVTFLNEAARQIELEFLSSISGVSRRESRSIECTNLVSKLMDAAVSAMYVKIFFSPERKTKVSQIVTNIYNQYESTIEQNNWLDETTRNFALKKLRAMYKVVGCPDELYDNKKVNDYYLLLNELKSNEYFQNVLNLRKFHNDYSVSTYKTPADRKDWVQFKTAAVINAGYSPYLNAIFLPAGILRGIYFNENKPDSINYGTIGYVIGHEITHAFDTEGRKFDDEGNLMNWWTPMAETSFLNRSKCVENQYNGFIEKTTGLPVNGALTLGENLADLGGIEQAFLAYTTKVLGVQPGSQITDLNLNKQKLLFISAVSAFCVKMSIPGLQTLIASGPHSPPEFRINGPLKNLDEFSRTFNCSKGTPMNPDTKCSVW